jgi:hypothetical protein
LVKPVSNTNGRPIATSTALLTFMKPSKTLRAAMSTQLLVWYALCAQSNWMSFGTNSWQKNRLICAWRISSNEPKIAMFRQPPVRPKRAIFSSESTATYSMRLVADECAFEFVTQPGESELKISDRCSAALTE